MEHFKFVLFLLPMAAAIVLALFVHRSINRRRLAPLGEVLDGGSAEAHGLLCSSIDGHFNGSEAAFKVVLQGRHRPPQFRIQLACPSSADFRITAEDAGSRMKKKLGLLRDVEVGDPSLDDRFVLSSSAPESFKRWFGEPAVREQVVALMDLGLVGALQLRDGRLATAKAPFRRRDLDPAAVRNVLERLEALVRTIERTF